MCDPWRCPECGWLVIKRRICNCGYSADHKDVDAEAETKLLPAVKPDDAKKAENKDGGVK